MDIASFEGHNWNTKHSVNRVPTVCNEELPYKRNIEVAPSNPQGATSDFGPFSNTADGLPKKEMNHMNQPLDFQRLFA